MCSLARCMNVAQYAKRLRWRDHEWEPTLDCLEFACEQHLMMIPFENLDVVAGREIRIDTEQLIFDKLIDGRRGGLCFELNGLFAWLLAQSNYRVTYLEARVFSSGTLSEVPCDHMVLLVEVPGETAQYLVDVGFGDSFVQPLELADGVVVTQQRGVFRLDKGEFSGRSGWTLSRQAPGGGAWEKLYAVVSMEAKRFPDDFLAACKHHQVSKDSPFTQGLIASVLTKTGRVTVSKKGAGPAKLTVTEGGAKTEVPLPTEEDVKNALLEHMGLKFP
ncbi:Arylamine N-acetyltransferase [Diplonema papillatum]|nr:Arylamine N-acetyltransferase [Diplonema papillatum]|eukprot:gene3670-5709_t